MSNDTLTSSDLYMRYTDKEGASHVMHHRVWDGARFVRARQEEHAKEGGRAERITRDQYEQGRRAKTVGSAS